MRHKIVSLGEVLWDLFPDGERFGGAPANFACHAAIGKSDVSMISAIGDDDRGRQAVSMLNGYGIDTRLLQVHPSLPTGTVGIVVDQHGKPTFTITEGSAWDCVQWNDQLDAAIREQDALYFGTLGQRSAISRQTIRRCVAVARDAGIPRILDVNLRSPFFDDELVRDSIAMCSVLKLSDDELPNVTSALNLSGKDSERTLPQLLVENSLDLVVMTKGADGAMLVSRDGIVNQAGIETEVLDTVGAGDAFTATFVRGMLAGVDHERLLKTACESATAVCRIRGAVPPLS